MSDPVAIESRLAYTIDEVAELVGVHRTTVYDWVRDGRLGSVKIGGSRRVPRECVLALLNPDAERQAERAETERERRERAAESVG